MSHSFIYNTVVNKNRGEMIMKKDIVMQNHAPIVYRKDRKIIAMHIKAMAIVLVAAFVVSAASALIVHSLAHSGSAHSKSAHGYVTRISD